MIIGLLTGCWIRRVHFYKSPARSRAAEWHRTSTAAHDESAGALLLLLLFYIIKRHEEWIFATVLHQPDLPQNTSFSFASTPGKRAGVWVKGKSKGFRPFLV
jgi:hypothetical protein